MVVDEFVAVAHRIVWCSVATVDRRGRPRSRVMHPVWERTPDGLVGWITARPTPLKLAHLERTPYVSCSYWDPAHDVAVAECDAAWVHDAATQERAWVVCRSFPEPLGFDPASIFPDGPGSPGAGLLRVDPWRLRVLTAADASTGGAAAVWRRGAYDRR